MTDERPTPAYLCGQLYATLHALRAVGERDRALTNTKNLDKAALHPGPSLRDHLAQAGRHLLAAHARGPRYGKVATALFRALPDLLPPDGLLPQYLHGSRQDDFREGFRHQHGEHVVAHGDLVR
ncbi:hypothetical protein P1P68_39645 [Streptomyces scabiei]|uniref:hypothetical protein n=1 Tax=Streptomyces scabiei TaxID=1930 RepID=UPI0029905FDC|nr:hypothetical protein [Streptomyces scabiei]MDW8810754.1 hypothetical protein [Streptomyces scabiei]